MRPTEKDLFAEEKTMPAMSFGDHIEELRVRLILALIGLFVGLIVTFIPVPIPGHGVFYLGQWVMTRMQEPAEASLKAFYDDLTAKRIEEAKEKHSRTDPFVVEVSARDFATEVRKLFPSLPQPSDSALKDKTVKLSSVYEEAQWIKVVNEVAEKRRSALISLAPLETFMIFFMVCLVTGLVIASPWVFYQIWEFIAAGLYRHERKYVLKFLPFSIGLFLGGVFLCFQFVLPFTLQFLLEFNVWLGIEPTLRITDWISFATILPLVFGVCFQTPLLMLLLERIGIFTADTYRKNRRYAIVIIVVAAAVITPTGDPFTLSLLAIPMYALYELGIRLIPDRARTDVATMSR